MEEDNHIFKNQLLISIFSKMWKLSKPCEAYGRFFDSHEYRDINQRLTFANKITVPSWAYQYIPKSGVNEQNLHPVKPLFQKELNKRIRKMNINSTALDYAMWFDKCEEKPKTNPVEVFFVDLRALKVKDRLDKLVLMTDEEIDMRDTEKDHFIGLSKRELAYFLYRQNKMYGDDIEK